MPPWRACSAGNRRENNFISRVSIPQPTSQSTSAQAPFVKSSLFFGIGVSVFSFLFFGSVTTLLQNPYFTRMTPVGVFDYVILALTSLLLGVYAGLRRYHRNAASSAACSYAAGGGVAGGVLSFGCALCNKLFLLLLGVGGVTALIMPLQPYLGVLGVLLLGFAVYKEFRRVK